MKRLWAVLALLLFAPAAASAQDDGCAPLIERALSGTATQCASVAPGHVCFGHPAIDFTTQGDAPEFSAAGHTLPLDLACCMRLSPLHPPDAWGMALMRVAPDGEGPGPTILLIGELEIQNAASFFSEIAAQVLSDTAIYAGPGSHYAALAQVKAGRRAACERLQLHPELAAGAPRQRRDRMGARAPRLHRRGCGQRRLPDRTRRSTPRCKPSPSAAARQPGL